MAHRHPLGIGAAAGSAVRRHGAHRGSLRPVLASIVLHGMGAVAVLGWFATTEAPRMPAAVQVTLVALSPGGDVPTADAPAADAPTANAPAIDAQTPDAPEQAIAEAHTPPLPIAPSGPEASAIDKLPPLDAAPAAPPPNTLAEAISHTAPAPEPPAAEAEKQPPPANDAASPPGPHTEPPAATMEAPAPVAKKPTPTAIAAPSAIAPPPSLPATAPPTRVAASLPRPPAPAPAPKPVARPTPGTGAVSSAAPQPGAPPAGAVLDDAPLVLTAARFRQPPAPPTYPPRARDLGLEGEVVLRVLIDRHGTAESITLTRTSGHPMLDQAAIAAVRNWMFEPGRRGGVAMPAVVQIPIRFGLR